jgi:hypothetical protein
MGRGGRQPLPLCRWSDWLFLIEIFLPLASGGDRINQKLFDDTRDELMGRFGGLTMYARSPATGLWAPDGREPEIDDIVIYEIMTDQLDRAWWSQYRDALQVRFQQKDVVIRAVPIEVL